MEGPTHRPAGARPGEAGPGPDRPGIRPTDYNIGVNIGRDAGQTVLYVHIHIIPLYAGDCEDPTGGGRGVIPGKGRYR